MTSRGLILRNLFRKKLRTFLTIFAILVAFAIFGVLAAMQTLLSAPPQGAVASRLVTLNAVTFTNPLPVAYYDKIKAMDDVKVATTSSWFGGYYQEPKNFLVAFAVDSDTYLDVYSEFRMTPEARAAFVKDRTAIMVGQAIADKYGWEPGDKIPLKSNIFRQKDGSDTWTFTVAGTFTNAEQENGDQQVFFHYDYFNESKAFGRDTIGNIVFVPKDPARNDATAQKIDAMFQNSPAETETKSEAAFAQSFIGQIGDIGFIITAVAGAAFVTILLIVGNTMMLTVRERTGEIAVLKTIGFTARRIFAMVLTESMLLAFIGGLIGLALAFLGISAINKTGMFFGAAELTPALLAFAVGLMALLGFLTGFIPAWRAMQTDIVSAFGKK